MFQTTPEGVIISLHVLPNAPKNEVIGEYNGALKIKIKSPPVDGKANAEITAFLANQLALPKKRVEILKGDKSKQKKVLILGLSIAQIRSLLQLE